MLIRHGVASDALILSTIARRTFFDTFAATNDPGDMAIHLERAYGVAQQGAEALRHFLHARAFAQAAHGTIRQLHTVGRMTETKGGLPSACEASHSRSPTGGRHRVPARNPTDSDVPGVLIRDRRTATMIPPSADV